jgi:hypothetical protein
LSALAFLALCVLWWRSDTHEDGLQLGTVGGAMWGVNSRRDRIEVLRVGDWPVREGPGVQTSSDDRPAPMTLVYLSPPTSDWFGFGMSVTRGSGAIPLNPDGTPWQHRRSDGLSGVRHWKFCPALRIALPHWLPMLPTAVLPLIWAVRRAGRNSLRLRRARAGRCIQCGYDLRATTAGRCPECGAPAPTAPRATG